MKRPWYQRWFFSEPVPDFKVVRDRAEQGDADAQFALGMSCDFRSIDAHGEQEAALWFRRAADQGHMLAQFNLAVMYAAGHGVALDETAAESWYRRAADGGDAGAQYQMGKRCQRDSFGKPQTHGCEDRIEAYKWFKLAAVQGYKDSAVYLERVGLTLTREELDEGQRRTTRFTVRPKIN